MELNPIGPPHNFYIKFPRDSLPEPVAIFITGITPQKAIADGITEAEFLKIFDSQIATPETIMVGFNTLRFDDEFMRYLRYRNFYDAYEWGWKDGRSRWDLLDMVRMVRALRPSDIKWPFNSDGQPTNRLELLTALNKLSHDNAHDALNDVYASIAVAKLMKDKQPKLFDFLLNMRTKQAVAKLVHAGQPYLYTSGRYANEFEKTTVVATLADHPDKQAAFVFDLRYDPTPFAKLKPDAMVEAWRRKKGETGPRLPVKTITFNRCPAIAPLSVLDEASQKRLKLNPQTIAKNFKALQEVKDELVPNMLAALRLITKKQQLKFMQDDQVVDNLLYDGFFEPADQKRMAEVRSADPQKLKELTLDFEDSRLQALLPLYKARNFPQSLTNAEQKIWENYRTQKLLQGKRSNRLVRFYKQLDDMKKKGQLTDHQKYLLEELRLFAESIMPVEA
ncbi:MAG: exonuclease [Candidatus Saccharibacteria bacterium]|nr:exonuclease [Candidatus Saccharibacteria bacterium]